jgi:hypothetical protein
MFFALSIVQATLWSARAMQHVFFHSLIELGMNISVRNLGRDEGVDMLYSADLIVWFQEDEEMHVRQTVFLIFNGVHQSCNLAIVAITNLLQESLLFLIKYASHQVWTVHSTLTYIRKFVRSSH